MSDAPSAAELATRLTVAWLENPNTRAAADDVPAFFVAAHAAVAGLAAPDPEPADEQEQAPEYTPAVSARKSLSNPDRIVSMIDGKPYSSLTRHLKANGLTPDEYRQRYGLRADYPMVAPGYSKRRSEMSKRLGLGGGKRKAEAAPAAPQATPAPAGRKPRAKLGIAAAKAAAKAHLGGRGAGAKA